MKFSIKDFFSKCEQIRRKLRIWSHLLKKSLMENFIFCALTNLQMLDYKFANAKLFMTSLFMTFQYFIDWPEIPKNIT